MTAVNARAALISHLVGFENTLGNMNKWRCSDTVQTHENWFAFKRKMLDGMGDAVELDDNSGMEEMVGGWRFAPLPVFGMASTSLWVSTPTRSETIYCILNLKRE